MQLSRLFFRIALLLLPVALIGTTWLYLYPVFQGCAFPAPPPTHSQAIAPFRLLSLGDPQLEGDSSLPDPNALVFPSVEFLIPRLRNAANSTDRADIAKEAARGVVKDAGKWLEGKRKAIDLWGNDWYLAHIVRSLTWWTGPTHISVLGDLLGSQWVTDGEFSKRAGRYWNIVMRGLEKIPETVYGADENAETQETPPVPTAEPTIEQESEGEDNQQEEEDNKPLRTPLWGGTTEVLGVDPSWSKRVINIVGNHDVGYAGDIDESRIERFEQAFGAVNWEIWFTLPDSLRSNKSSNLSPSDAARPPTLRLVILNSMNLDTPAWSTDLQTETYSYMNHIITSSLPVSDKTHATILLTHIPLEKEAGVCVDSPYFDFFEGGQGVKEQNMLSDHASKIILEGFFGMTSNKDAEGGGMGRRGVVINGHDHAGCDVVHWIRQPGVADTCDANQIKRHEAYWPSTTEEVGMLATKMDIDGIDINVVAMNDTDTDASEPQPLANATDPNTSPEPTADPPIPGPAPSPPPTWKARTFPPRSYDISSNNECTNISASPHIREITLRSMMGEFSGYAGFLSAWFDEEKGEQGEWVFEYGTCGVGVQHWWWGVHIVDLILIVALVAGAAVTVVDRLGIETEMAGKKVVVREKAKSGGAGGGVKTDTIVQSSTRGRTSSVTEVRERRIG
jgi:hypothetical protein